MQSSNLNHLSLAFLVNTTIVFTFHPYSIIYFNPLVPGVY